LSGAGKLIDKVRAWYGLARDLLWYCPAQRRRSGGNRADLAVRPGSIDELRVVPRACVRAGSELFRALPTREMIRSAVPLTSASGALQFTF
jgi:hypothetical protein